MGILTTCTRAMRGSRARRNICVIYTRSSRRLQCLIPSNLPAHAHHIHSLLLYPARLYFLDWRCTYTQCTPATYLLDICLPRAKTINEELSEFVIMIDKSNINTKCKCPVRTRAPKQSMLTPLTSHPIPLLLSLEPTLEPTLLWRLLLPLPKWIPILHHNPLLLLLVL